MNEIGSEAIEVFASGVSIPVKAGYCVAVMSYALMEGCPVSARMSNAGAPFLLKGFRVLGHIPFINSGSGGNGFIWDLYG